MYKCTMGLKELFCQKINHELKRSSFRAIRYFVSQKESRHPVKLNAAAILREGARVQKVENEEERRLASLEAGERDGSEFTSWQEEMKQKEAIEKLADIQRKHLVRICPNIL